MFETHAVVGDVRPKSVAEYAHDIASRGTRVFPGSQATFWMRYEASAMMRMPVFQLPFPEPGEVARVLWRGRSAVASYVIPADDQHPANAWLYTCTDRQYALEKLAPPVRRNIRRGLQELTIASLTPEQLQAHGFQAFCDTRRRSGLNDGTPEVFHQHLVARAHLPESALLGAWKDDTLTAFLTIVEVDDWAELGCYSADAFLTYRPNDTLMYSVLTRYLVERQCRLVSYGLSSLQSESNAAGLHRFKLKIGFEARPVHRVFVPHPLLRPFVQHFTHRGLQAALKLAPQNRRLKKAEGMLGSILGNARVPEPEKHC